MPRPKEHTQRRDADRPSLIDKLGHPADDRRRMMVSNLKVGTAVVDITPDRLLPLEGYQPRLADGTLDPLVAGAIVFDDGLTRAAFVSADLCGILPSSVQR